MVGMSIAEKIFKFLAARFHIPPDALDYFLISRHIGNGAATMLPFPAELIPIGARLVARGWLNQKFFPTNRDWILPYWAERQFDPNDPAFIPHGFNLYTLNYTHRDWTLVGNPARAREAIVDPRGLVTAWFDGWSLDIWINVDGKFFAPSRLNDQLIAQTLHENMPMVVTTFAANGLRVQTETFATENAEAREFIATKITVENPYPAAHRATLYVAFRPFNPEGVSVIRKIKFQSHRSKNNDNSQTRVFINNALAAQLRAPDAVACSRFRDGDVALESLNGATQIECDAGLATAVSAYDLNFTAAQIKTINVLMPITPELVDPDEPREIIFPDANAARLETIALWRAQQTRGMQILLPDAKMQNAFDANKNFLLALADGDTITPGPYTYHQFWMRDAAYLLNALDKVGYHSEARAVIEKIPRRLQKNGYVRATEGEWDSNGAAIWTMVEHARVSGDWDLVAQHYWSVLQMAAWINSKRQKSKTSLRAPQGRSNLQRGAEIASSQRVYPERSEGLFAMTNPSPHDGLLPSGPSAEHLGPADYFYWDNFWSLAGLRESARAAEMLKQDRDAEKLRANFESFRADVDASLARVAARLQRAAMPASPYRRLDSAMIGSLAALYPLRLMDARDARIVDTLAAIKEIAWKENAFFHHVGHSAFGTYLSLHVAQCFIFQRDAAALDILQWVLNHASPTFTWAEGIHPATRGGAMGDGHHGWALADFLLAVRNLLLFEEENHLVITPVMPTEWAAENNVIKVEHAPTYFGEVSYTIAFGANNATLVLNADWRAAPDYVEWNLPFVPRELGDEGSGATMQNNRVKIPRGGRRVVVMR
ncbi:MAG: hypothetical protein HY257_05440 [Chloroflexi bacterium]|nr:hypothetical protein [Chloroflexota bacterium]